MTEVQDKRFWLAVYTKPRHEKIADEKLQEKGIESYLPLVKRTRQWKDRKKKVWMPLFKSYLFVHIPLKETLHVVQTYGVHHIVRFSRSEEHTSELQSRTNLVCRLLLEKKKKNK